MVAKSPRAVGKIVQRERSAGITVRRRRTRMTGWIPLAISLTALAASAVALVTVRGRWRAHARLTRSLAAAIARLAAAVAEMNAGLDRLSGETRLTVALGE